MFQEGSQFPEWITTLDLQQVCCSCKIIDKEKVEKIIPWISQVLYSSQPVTSQHSLVTSHKPTLTSNQSQHSLVTSHKPTLTSNQSQDNTH